MEIRYLQSFLQVAKENSFTKAAEKTGYSQAAVTVQIKQLEEEIGAPLFQRIGNKVCLTTVGERFLKYANEIVNINDHICNLLNSDPATMHGRLRIGFIDSLAPILASVIDEYHKSYPNVAIEALSDYNVGLYSSLRKNETDIIFAMGGKDAPQHCLEIAKQRVALVPFVSSEHPLACTSELTLKEVARYPIILSGTDSFLERELFGIADAQGFALDSFLRTDSNSLMIVLVEKGHGVGFLSEDYLRYFMRNHNVTALSVADYSYRYHICAYRNRHSWLSPQTQGFIDCMNRYL